MKLLSRAQREAEELQETAPKNIELLLKLAQIYYQMDDKKRADEYWEKVLIEDPSNDEAKSYLRHSSQNISMEL